MKWLSVFEDGTDAVRLALSRECRDAQVDARHSLQSTGNGEAGLSGVPDWFSDHTAAAVDQKVDGCVHGWNWSDASEQPGIAHKHAM